MNEFSFSSLLFDVSRVSTFYFNCLRLAQLLERNRSVQIIVNNVNKKGACTIDTSRALLIKTRNKSQLVHTFRISESPQ